MTSHLSSHILDCFNYIFGTWKWCHGDIEPLCQTFIADFYCQIKEVTDETQIVHHGAESEPRARKSVYCLGTNVTDPEIGRRTRTQSRSHSDPKIPITEKLMQHRLRSPSLL